MDSREVREERIGLGGAAAVLGRSASTVRRYVAEGRLHADRTTRGGYSLLLSEVEELARVLGSSGANDSEAAEDEEVFEGEVIGDETFEGHSRLPAVPFERYERLLQQGQDYKTRLEERTRQIDEVRQERDAARTEIDRCGARSNASTSSSSSASCKRRPSPPSKRRRRGSSPNASASCRRRSSSSKEKSAIHEERVRLEAELERPQEPRLLVAPLRRLKEQPPFPSTTSGSRKALGEEGCILPLLEYNAGKQDCRQFL
jgi:hypothetical protein